MRLAAIALLWLAPFAAHAQPAAPPPSGAARAAAGTAAAPAPTFDIDEYRVEGNTVLTGPDIERAVYDFLGPGKTVADVEKARAALDQLYAKAGYPTVSAEIPPQRVTDGVVILKVTERTVGRLRVRGSRYFDLGVIREGAPSVAEGRVPQMAKVQRDIMALNQWPDRSVTPSLKPGVAPGTIDVDLQVDDTLPLHGSLELNNRQSQDTKSLRISGSLTYDNLWQRGDSATVGFQVAPQRPSDATVVSGSYLFHIPGSNLSLLGSYLHSDSDVTTVGSTGVIGKGDIAGVRLLVPLGADADFVHTLSVGMDYKHFEEDVVLGADRNGAPITYYPMTATYQASWTGAQSRTNLVSSLVWAFPGLGSNALAFDTKRFDAKPNFFYGRADLTRTQTLPYDIQIYGHLSTQLAPEPLISNEQFALGGLDGVRGYLESEALGDYGASLQLEARTPSLSDYADWPQLDEARLFAFTDAGSTAIHNPLFEQKQSYTLASTGVGLRVRLFGYLNGELVGAFALTDGQQTKAGTSRALFRLYGDF